MIKIIEKITFADITHFSIFPHIIYGHNLDYFSKILRIKLINFQEQKEKKKKKKGNKKTLILYYTG